MVKEIGFAKVAKEKFGEHLGPARKIKEIKSSWINISNFSDISDELLDGKILKEVPRDGADYYTRTEVVKDSEGTEFSSPTYGFRVTFYRDVTPKHPRNVVGYTGSLNDLSKEIGDMQYDCIASVLDGLSDYLTHQAKQDERRNRPKLAAEITEAVEKLKLALPYFQHAHQICLPYLESEKETM